MGKVLLIMEPDQIMFNLLLVKQVADADANTKYQD
jgi:hypothetical protein